MENYTPYGKEWEAEMMKLPKKILIEMFRKAHIGTTDNKAFGIEDVYPIRKISRETKQKKRL